MTKKFGRKKIKQVVMEGGGEDVEKEKNRRRRRTQRTDVSVI